MTTATGSRKENDLKRAARLPSLKLVPKPAAVSPRRPVRIEVSENLFDLRQSGRTSDKGGLTSPVSDEYSPAEAKLYGQGSKVHVVATLMTGVIIGFILGCYRRSEPPA